MGYDQPGAQGAGSRTRASNKTFIRAHHEVAQGSDAAGKIQQKAASEDAKFAEEKKVEDIPLPNDIEVREEYEREKVRYQKAARNYERQGKLALETFPVENKKVFSRLIDCISEASVQDLKRTKEGAKYFEEADSFNFLQLAVVAFY